MEKRKLKDGFSLSSSPIVIKDKTLFDLKGKRVAIIMATYNGGRFIEEQIRSIQAQSYSDWVLFVRDDGSHDDTVQKVLMASISEPRIKIVLDAPGNQGAIGNFSSLMQIVNSESADYIFFADQDDVWHPEKVLTMLGGMQELESEYGNHKPLLVHCDLTVVDENLNTIANSFARFSRLSPITADLGVLLCQNQVTGCACVINRSLLELALPVPSNVLMHDWWLALLASTSGKIGYMPKQLVSYRQHGGNVLGAVSFNNRLKKLLFSYKAWALHVNNIKRSFEQAKLLEKRISDRKLELPQNSINQINVYAHILNTSPCKRAKKLRENKIGRNSIRTGWVVSILLFLMRKNGNF